MLLQPMRLHNSHTTIYFLTIISAPKTHYLSGEVSTVSMCDCSDQYRYFNPNRDIFLTLTKWFLSLNRSRADAQ